MSGSVFLRLIICQLASPPTDPIALKIVKTNRIILSTLARRRQDLQGLILTVSTTYRRPQATIWCKQGSNLPGRGHIPTL